MRYFIDLKMILGEIEKHSTHLITADDEAEAKDIALRAECHYTPDASEFPDGDGIWDGDQFVYQVYICELISEDTFLILKKYL